MSTGLLGMDVGASRALAAKLDGWPSGLEEVIALVTEAEVLADMPVGITSLLDSIGGDGAVMAAAIRRAADELESFTLQLDSPLDIAAAVYDVKSFRGTDNDPELDKRLRALRELVEAHTSSDVETARVMNALLAVEQSVDVRYRDTDEVEVKRAKVEHLNHLEATGAISSNDPLIDDAVRELRDTLAAHADTEDQANDLLYAFLDSDARGVATSTLLASVLEDKSVEVVRVAHANNIDYDIAETLITLDKVDRLTANMATAPNWIIDRLASERRDLLVELVGGSDPHVLAAITEQLGDGASAIDAFAGLDLELANRAEQAHGAQVAVIGEGLDLDYDQAEVRLAEMTAETEALIAQGWQAEDAAKVVQAAAFAELDLDIVVEVAADPNLSVNDAIEKAVFADAYGMTVAEYDAYRAFDEFFPVFDNASGGDADGVVSISDLTHVVNNADHFTAAQVAAAAAILAAPGLRNRLDSARDHGNVVGQDSFGADRPQDHKFSRADMNTFDRKQMVNFVLRDHVDAIDVANQGGDPGQVDGNLRKEDFEAYLASPAGAELDDQTRNTIQTVIDADWYDQDFWQRHGDAVIFVAGLAVGAIVVSVTMGAGAGAVAATLMATTAGAGTGATLTVAENALTGDPLDEDLLSNTAMGALGGATAASFMTGQPADTVVGRIASVVGTGADVAGIVASGAVDPVLEPFMDDMALRGLHDDAQLLNYVGGAASVTLHGSMAAGTRITASLDSLDNAMFPALAVPTSAASRAARNEALDRIAAEAFDEFELESVQRVISLGLDTVQAGTSD